ncbi:PepSY-associated TM helix domain-containing protein [Phenylobacterium sp.]|uniref:PepSY-associated TM helix domain-containing protein n=1 Tax=Phenylobacterium sp. TaxID=1871053 RepID=UPI00289CF1DB|nr:PepSY-associated TM helix domain-containing protein [Phenylobacterium sp.]
MSKPIWPKIPPGFVRAVLAGHSALGLAFAALIYLVCFSGSVAVFAEEFHRWERPAAPQLSAATPQALQTLLAEAVAKAPGAEHVYIYAPQPASPTLVAYVDHPTSGASEWVADAGGRIVGPGETPWTEFMTRLHINLHLPQTWGIFVVGLTGVALLSSLISGVLAHPRVFKDAFHLRWGGSKRLQEADLHNRIGVWALPFHVAISLTGALLGLTTIIVGVLALAVFKGDTEKAYALFLPPHPIDDPRPAPAPDLKGAMLKLNEAAPGMTPTFIAVEHPGERGSGMLINTIGPDTLSRGDSFTFDREGRMVSASRFDENNLGQRIINVLGAIHFGWFGGGLVKIVYAVLGLGLATVTSSGVAIWLARRRAKGRPAPGWERVWIATVWSQPFAFAAAALASLVAPWPALAVWAAATLASLAAARAWTPQAISRRLRLATAALVASVGVLHLALNRQTMVDPMAWIVDAALLLVAAGLAASVLSLPRRVAADAPVAAE